MFGLKQGSASKYVGFTNTALLCAKRPYEVLTYDSDTSTLVKYFSRVGLKGPISISQILANAIAYLAVVFLRCGQLLHHSEAGTEQKNGYSEYLESVPALFAKLS